MNLKASAVLESVGMPALDTVRDLGKDKAITIPLKGRVNVYCLSGNLWASVEGKSEDIIVQAGQTRVIEGRGRLVVSALDSSRIWIG
ncbi:MAG TPA: DUF2917 domain-containing protein [Rectinemataceae bacterium]|nr:DUF2917 domain-containing protein [Rectinemataceae bacterium]